jgi:hypothetical protein
MAPPFLIKQLNKNKGGVSNVRFTFDTPPK